MSPAFATRETAWCPGCGNFALLECLKTALNELGLDPERVLLVAGIGQAAKTPQYVTSHAFCGLHGRALPPAAAAKMANEDLVVVVSTGDGDTYGEGGNHFLHNIRRNVDIAHFVHDNQVYGLTKGQASPTTDIGQVTDVQVTGNQNRPLNPMLTALAAGAGFVARGFIGDREQLTDLMKAAIRHPGYALVDIFQPCVSFNKVNTFAYYSKRVYRLGPDHDPSDFAAALRVAGEFGDRVPTGILYQEQRPTFHQRHPVLSAGGPLLDRKRDPALVARFCREFV